MEVFSFYPALLRLVGPAPVGSNPDFYIMLNRLQDVAQSNNIEEIPLLISKLLPDFSHATNKVAAKLFKNS